MNVTNVSLRPTEAAAAAGRPTLTPELLAASGARYSRNNEGLEAILSKIDPNNLDKSVDSIFRMIDYGHQSISDMVPVAMFIDGVSIHLAYLVWSWSPTAGGQESSTRYIKLSADSLADPASLGVPSGLHETWYRFMERCFASYEAALTFWERIGAEYPRLTRIPTSLLGDPGDKAGRQVARMKRNFAFDRARYFLPLAAKTNLMLVMSARAWVQLCQNLLSHSLPEAHQLGERIREELRLSAPRMTKHAERSDSFVQGHRAELDAARACAGEARVGPGEADATAEVQLLLPPDVSERDLVKALQHHEHRYAFTGSAVRRSAIRFWWHGVAAAEIRDLNRHRTGERYCSTLPLGFYCAEDELPGGVDGSGLDRSVGDEGTSRALEALRAPDRSDIGAWALLGTQYRFEHTTTLDKFIYEAELRTGAGAHFRYAKHLRDAVAQLGRSFPSLAAAVRLGEAEPE